MLERGTLERSPCWDFVAPLALLAKAPEITLDPTSKKSRGSSTQGVGGGHLVEVAWASRKDRERLRCQAPDDFNRSTGK